ncbi:response regulator FixJ [Brevundimonas sp. SL130]|uniref:response regulator FixJ n=1 Tax=Brevundimonas sp. SL130 TaxID=2995143 RepID=UPI00226C6AED|nr:response regulator FixJ [Brevundimonas sp. SL130]WAC59065.1 response regulator FixJ [Brevundimonas sp. SL130]
MAHSPTIHVIDDDAAMRQSLLFLLDVHGYAVRTHASATGFLQAVPDDGDCILTDIRMPEMTGLDLVRRLRSDGHTHSVVVMTGHGDIALAVEAMKAGVTDFIEKPFTDDVLIAAVTACVSAGQPPSQEEAAREAELKLSTLSPRERDVLIGVIAGKLNKVIAFELEISPRTVEIYRAHLMTKTGAQNMPGLMRIALAAGL